MFVLTRQAFFQKKKLQSESLTGIEPMTFRLPVRCALPTKLQELMLGMSHLTWFL